MRTWTFKLPAAHYGFLAFTATLMLWIIFLMAQLSHNLERCRPINITVYSKIGYEQQAAGTARALADHLGGHLPGYTVQIPEARFLKIQHERAIAIQERNKHK